MAEQFCAGDRARGERKVQQHVATRHETLGAKSKELARALGITRLVLRGRTGTQRFDPTQAQLLTRGMTREDLAANARLRTKWKHQTLRPNSP